MRIVFFLLAVALVFSSGSLAATPQWVVVQQMSPAGGDPLQSCQVGEFRAIAYYSSTIWDDVTTRASWTFTSGSGQVTGFCKYGVYLLSTPWMWDMVTVRGCFGGKCGTVATQLIMQ
jgi:hypothetical protein